ncbi:MAG: type IV secretion system DNA-binding domain-containing protein [Nitrospirae bacterium]|nr:type IV secretion system DNA-binding domain-containing protein [Nitrospirota bacterium]
METYKGFGLWWNAVRLNAKMHLYTMLLLVMVHLFSFLFMALVVYRTETNLSFKYLFAQFVPDSYEMSLVAKSGAQYRMTANKVREVVAPYADEYCHRMKRIFLQCGVVYLFFPIVIGIFKYRAVRQRKRKYERGAILTTPREINKQIRKDKENADLPFGGVRLPVSAEPKHTFIVGRPGVGKTVFLSQVLERLKERGDRGIVYDFKGDYVSRFYNPDTDILFNPLDRRCFGWSIFNEITTAMDIDAIAHSLIPQAATGDPFWNDAARDVFAGILHYLYQGGAKTNADIWKEITAPGEQITDRMNHTVGGQRGCRYIEDPSSKQALSIFSVMMQFTKSFEYMSGADGSFSIFDWLESGKGWIFVTNYADVQDSLKPILSLFIDLVGRRLLSMKDDYHRRIFFFLDELGTLQKLSTIVRLLTLSRSKGGSCWLGIQDIGQVDKIYSEQLRQAIVNACGNSVTFSVADPTTADFLSRKIGETEFWETEESYSDGVANTKDGYTQTRRRKTERLVLPSDIMNLRDLECMVKIANYDITKTKLAYKAYDDRNEPFLLRPDFLMDTIIKQQVEIRQEIVHVNRKKQGAGNRGRAGIGIDEVADSREIGW